MFAYIFRVFPIILIFFNGKQIFIVQQNDQQQFKVVQTLDAE